MKPVPKEAGKSSYDLLDPKKFLAALPLDGVMSLLDLGCGVGNYALAIARNLPRGSQILGIDLWPEGIATLTTRAKEENLPNVSGLVDDLGNLKSVGDHTVDLALLATVFHDLVERSEQGQTLAALNRVLKPAGILAVVEFKKINSRPGPPEHIRLSPEELQEFLNPAGFNLTSTTDLGEHLYLAIYTKR